MKQKIAAAATAFLAACSPSEAKEKPIEKPTIQSQVDAEGQLSKVPSVSSIQANTRRQVVDSAGIDIDPFTGQTNHEIEGVAESKELTSQELNELNSYYRQIKNDPNYNESIGGGYLQFQYSSRTYRFTLDQNLGRSINIEYRSNNNMSDFGNVFIDLETGEFEGNINGQTIFDSEGNTQEHQVKPRTLLGQALEVLDIRY